MLDAETMQMALVALAAVSAAIVIYLLAYPLISGSAKAEKRLQGVTDNATKRTVRNAQTEQINNRRKQVADTLKELELKQKQREKVTMRMRLERAGLDITPQVFWIASAVSGLVLGVVAFVSLPGMNPLISVAVAFVGVLGLPRWVVSRMIKRRQSKFLEEFANSIDVIVRGVKAGLPLGDCIRIISTETQEPVKSEFRMISEATAVGVPLAEACGKLYDRIPLPESNFFAIVIAIQQKAGGSLAEALGNLAHVLRDRRKMRAKIIAMSMEAKASAAIIAALPIAVMLLVYLTSPGYIELLWKEPFGRMMLAASGGWMLLGTFVMRRMINFDF